MYFWGEKVRDQWYADINSISSRPQSKFDFKFQYLNFQKVDLISIILENFVEFHIFCKYFL